MRSFACLGLLLLMALASGCDSDQPLVLADRNVTLQFSAPEAEVANYDVWDLTEDASPGEQWLWCERVAAPNDYANASSVPWTYSLRVSILREGEVDFERITSEDALGNGNRAGYDTGRRNNLINRPAAFDVSHDRGECSGNTSLLCNPDSTASFCDDRQAGDCVPVYTCDAAAVETRCDPDNLGDTCSIVGAGVCTPAGTCSGNPGIVCEPTCEELGLGSCEAARVARRFRLNQPTRRRITAASIDFARPAGNLLNDTCAGNSCTGIPVALVLPGLCPSHSLGPPKIDQQDPPFSLTLLKGETLMVEARRFATIPVGIPIRPQTSGPRIRATMSVDGIELQPSDFCPANDQQCNITEQDSVSEIKFFFVSK